MAAAATQLKRVIGLATAHRSPRISQSLIGGWCSRLVGASLVCAATACSVDYANDESTPAIQALAARGISASLTYKSDWRSGYCSRVSITNTGTDPLSNWKIVINLGQARLAQVTNASSSLDGQWMTVTSSMNSPKIGAGDSASFEFCANAGGPNYHPTLESVSAPST